MSASVKMQSKTIIGSYLKAHTHPIYFDAWCKEWKTVGLPVIMYCYGARLKYFSTFSYLLYIADFLKDSPLNSIKWLSAIYADKPLNQALLHLWEFTYSNDWYTGGPELYTHAANALIEEFGHKSLEETLTEKLNED